MLTGIKTLLGIDQADSSQDELLSLYLDIVKQKALNYCKRDDIPEGLELIIVEITADHYREKTRAIAIENGEKRGALSSVKRGDAQFNYETSASKSNYNKLTGAGGADFISNYKAQLDQFKTDHKKVRFI